MTIQRIEAKLDALIDVLGFDAMIGETYQGECICSYGAQEIKLIDAQRKHHDKIVKVVDHNDNKIIAIYELKQKVKLAKRVSK